MSGARVTTTASAPGWWRASCATCGWHDDPTGDEATAERAAAEHRCAPAVGTGYADNFGNIWIFSDGYTEIDGVVVRGSLRPGQRRKLQPGEVYYSTRGERLVVT